jgi:arginase
MGPSRVVIGVPVDSAGIGGGLELAPIVLRRLGLRGAVGARRDFNDMPVRIRGGRDPESGVIGFSDVSEMTREVRGQVAALLADGILPVIAGGCCSYLPGALAGARDVFGSVGLAYVDGHIDLYDGKTSPTGECADMPLAVVLGHGPEAFAPPMGKRIVIATQDVALLGARDLEDAAKAGSALPADYGLTLHDPDTLRETGLARAGEEAAARLAASPGRFWLHLDYDVLDADAFPAVDYRMPGGLLPDELVELIRPLFSSDAMIGLSLACYNPDLDDADFTSGKLAVDILRRAFDR